MFEIRKDLLSDLADHLEKRVPKSRFSINSWSYVPTRHACKTAGCAIGHAPNVPSIRKTGFTCNTEPLLPPLHCGDTQTSGWRAVCKLFNISTQQAENLFSAFAYKSVKTTTKEQVARRIRDFIKRPKFYERTLGRYYD